MTSRASTAHCSGLVSLTALHFVTKWIEMNKYLSCGPPWKCTEALWLRNTALLCHICLNLILTLLFVFVGRLWRLVPPCCPKWPQCWPELWWPWAFRNTGPPSTCSHSYCLPSDRPEPEPGVWMCMLRRTCLVAPLKRLKKIQRCIVWVEWMRKYSQEQTKLKLFSLETIFCVRSFHYLNSTKLISVTSTLWFALQQVSDPS